ncbi:MAG: hypothetical protein RBT87_13180, partial [bacterium]|nr:hypothetical protein [bacterium]
FWSCTSCNSGETKTDMDTSSDKDSSLIDLDNTQSDIDNVVPDSDMIDSDSEKLDTDSDSEKPDVDMYCPLPMDANYPYFRRDGTIHFCRPCDTPDEYDPQCVKSLWKDLNKEVYDMYKNGEFEDNEYIAECYPWPCEWNLTPTPNELESTSAHKCDIFLNPRTWANSFSGINRESNMENGKIVFWLYNYRISAPETSHGYQGQRAVIYDIATGKYTVLGKSLSLFYMNDHIVINPYISKDEKGFKPIVDMVPYKDSYKYSVIFTDEDTNVSLSASPYITDRWTIMNINHLDDEDGSVGAGNRSLVYAKTGEWKWTTLAYGNPDGKAGELSIAGDKAMFYHYGTDASWLCDLSKNPKKITDCKRIGKENEVAGFPKFDGDNPNRIAYRPMADGIPRNRFVIMDISKEPWKIEKEFDIPKTEEKYLKLQLTDFKSNIMLYREDIAIDGGYDGKLCYYRIDKGKTYCSKPIEGQTSYGHGWPAFEGKYLFWQPAYKAGYILRDMECYCKEEGVCPFEE